MLEGKDSGRDPAVGRGDRRLPVRAKAARTCPLSMTKLSVNVNKVATVRNSRGGRLPSVIDAVRVCIDAGAPGITVHPRADARHITFDDVREIAEELAPLRGKVEFNIEGDPRPDFLPLVLEVEPDQCTLVPGAARRDHEPGRLAGRHAAGSARRGHPRLHGAGVRVSLFVDPQPAPIRWARSWTPIASSSTPSRLRARSSAVRRRRRRASQSTSPRPRWRTRSGWASTPATISICGT